MWTVPLLLLWLAALIASFVTARRPPARRTVLFDDPAESQAEPDASGGTWRDRLRKPSEVAAIVLGIGALLITLDSLRAPGRGTSTLSIHGVVRQITSERGVEAEPALSPDGRYIAYRQQIDGAGAIMVQPIDGDEARNVTAGLDGDHGEPAFSPDGRLIAFRSTHANGGIFLVERDGGRVRRLTAFGASPAWTPDGAAIVFATRSGADPRAWTGESEGWVVDVRTGQTTDLGLRNFRQPAVSPDGRRVAYWSGPLPRTAARRLQPRIWIAGIDGRGPHPISRGTSTDWSPVWSPGGEFLYFLSDRGGDVGIWRVGIDAQSGRPEGDPVRLDVRAEGAAHLTIASDGRRLAWSTLEWSPALFEVGFSADARAIRGAPAAIGGGEPGWTCAEPSPDGAAVAFVTPDPGADVHILDVASGRARALTADPARQGCPRWSPDGRRLAFQARAESAGTLWIADADGSRLVDAGALGELEHPVWHPDGQSLAAWDPRESALRHVTLARTGQPSSRLLGAPPHPFTPVAWSPDGTRIAGTSAGSLWLYSVATRMYEPLVRGSAPTWLSSGRRLIYASDGRLMMIDLPTRFTREILSMPELHLDAPILSPDDRVLYFNRNVPESNVWLVVLN